MVLGTGIDIVAVDDVRHELARASWKSSDGIFRTTELRRINGGRHPAQILAVYFAIKEAALKALGLRVCDLRAFTEVEVARSTSSATKVVLHGTVADKARSVGVMHVVSASHVDRRIAAAMVIMEG